VSNVFVVMGGALVTSPRDVCLPGITRAEVLSVAHASGLHTREEPLPAHALPQAEEVFITTRPRAPRAGRDRRERSARCPASPPRS